MRFNAKRTWLMIGAFSLASLGCGHSRVARTTTTAPCQTCGSVVVASRSPGDPSVMVVQPHSTGTVVTQPSAMPHQTGPVTSMPSTIMPSPAVPAMPATIIPSPAVPSMPATITPKSTSPSMPNSMPKGTSTPTDTPQKSVPPMPSELPKKTTQLPTVDTSLKVNIDTLTLPEQLTVEQPQVKVPVTSVVKPTATNERMGQASDFSWLVGRLEYSRTKQIWRLRYASHEVEDAHGGVVTLIGMDDVLEKLSDGDLVKVDGQLVDPEKKQPSAAYRATSVRKLD